MVATAKRKILCSIIIALCLMKKKKKKRIWCKEWLTKRHVYGSHTTILQELQDGHEKDFRDYLRMSVSTFYTLLGKLESYIMKKDTHMRQRITTGGRLEATLRFLATGCTYSALQYSTRISKQSLSRIIPETCRAIYEVLKDDYLQTPTTPDEWMRVARGFETRWNFPNCIGAIDGKHILITPPQGSGSYYYNYKFTHSIVLMAITDANCEFLYVDIGCNGRVSDGGVWDNTHISSCIATEASGLPSDRKPKGSERRLPCVFVADNAFPLQRHIMKPFSHRTQSNRERNFSYRLSRA
ncbi:uncharacterized protein LOC135217767 [Macrobrachium nipponense]|uniref:uncharacterized protein LOC135217767 n=1 Tax=Macrobrachium nipponense TaxID=159736 RepID=UPI0030C832D8